MFQSLRIMTEAEYKQKKLELEAQRNSAIRLLQQGYEAQLGALELQWEREKEAPAPAPAAAPAPRHNPRPEVSLLDQVGEAVARLPTDFTKADIIRVLGYTPERSSLHRALDDLMAEGEVELHERGTGRLPNVYRKLRGGSPAGS